MLLSTTSKIHLSFYHIKMPFKSRKII